MMFTQVLKQQGLTPSESQMSDILSFYFQTFIKLQSTDREKWDKKPQTPYARKSLIHIVGTYKS